MLQLKNIKKSYTTAGFTQNALDGVSVAFRDNEFAAVLGPSGSGKTTMLNIIGGLDRYDSGDLEIDGISTEKYKSSDWDTYRNNRIGFVFQSYNLIPHQNVLSNVELALTLSGVSKGERRRRAKEALEEVGLGEHARKKPSQLSGGQMQRVAIARALINDPEILLADEPTGALDSATGLQVMDLLTKIAENRLVIMVTHNNELAGKYANRLIHLKDGRITSDSRPFDPAKEEQREAAKPRRAGMSFFTAVSLSLANLMTKKGRTFTTAFAGSIGIIGVATIMSFSNGINAYIAGIEEDTLSIYPLAIQQQSFDLSGFFGGGDDDGSQERGARRRERPEGTVREIRVMEAAFSTQSINDLASLKTHIDGNIDQLEPYVNAIQYTYDITPQIYLADTSAGIDQINPDSMFSGFMGGGDMAMMGGGMSFMPSMNTFYELPNEKKLYMSQYEVLAGRWPESYDEAVLVLQFGHGIMDFTLYSLGIRDRAEMRAMFESVMQGSDMTIEIPESEGFYTYETLMAAGFKVVNPAEIYHYDELYEVWVDKSGDEDYMKELLENSLDLKITGIVQPLEDASSTVLSSGINYTPELIFHLMQAAAETEIVKQQMANPDINVISGNTFIYEEENPPNTFDFSRIISVDEDIFQDAMGFDALTDVFEFDGMDFDNLDMSSLNMNAGNIDLSSFDFGSFDMGDFDFDFNMLNSLPVPEFTGEQLQQLIAAISAPFTGNSNLETALNLINNDIINIIEPLLPGIVPGTVTAEDITEAISGYFADGNNIDRIMAVLDIDPSVLSDQIGAALINSIMEVVQGYFGDIIRLIEGWIEDAIRELTNQIQDAMQDVLRQITRQIERAMRDVTGQIEDSIRQVFEDMAAQMEEAIEGFDGDALAEAFQIELSEEAILELMTAMMNPVTTSYEKNLSMFGYADMDTPTQIMFYPLSFESKNEVLDFLDRYNAEMERTNQPEKVIHFTDIVGVMMASVTNIVDIVSYALIAFVSVALVVSSIMIGVITFVSVLERKKEIGILRAVGASKGNIRLVFNAETLIIGFGAGVIGVIVTSFIIIIANEVLLRLIDVRNLVIMAPYLPVLMVGISMFLTFIAGLIPASAAASKPPVEALRSE